MGHYKLWAITPVVLLKDYGSHTPWKGVLCRTCLCLVQGIDPFNKEEQTHCWDAFATPPFPPSTIPLDS